jgi:hypothetical protein
MKEESIKEGKPKNDGTEKEEKEKSDKDKDKKDEEVKEPPFPRKVICCCGITYNTGSLIVGVIDIVFAIVMIVLIIQLSNASKKQSLSVPF